MLPYGEAIEELMKAPVWSKKSQEAIHTAIAVLTIAKVKESQSNCGKSKYEIDKEIESK